MSLVNIDREREIVADALGDTPETVIPAHLLRIGLADAYVSGSISRIDAVIVRSRSLLKEPWCFGNDPHAMRNLLNQLGGWGRCGMSPNVPMKFADSLSSLIQKESHLQVRHYGDVYHTLTGPMSMFVSQEVRLLNLGDSHLLEAFSSDPHRLGFDTFEDLLIDGAAAGAVVDDRLVSLAHTNAVTAGYGDIGVATDNDWRGIGFATASAQVGKTSPRAWEDPSMERWRRQHGIVASSSQARVYRSVATHVSQRLDFLTQSRFN